MKNYRLWGKQPYKVAVVHGGSGTPGSIGPVARDLSVDIGVLEPFQTRVTLEWQVRELRDATIKHAATSVFLIGHSWGAWMVFVFASRYPALVKKLILVGNSHFVQKYTESILLERLKRLTVKERVKVLKLIDVITGEITGDKDKSMGQLGDLFANMDTYDALTIEKEPEPLKVSEEINRKVWAEGETLRITENYWRWGEK